MLPRGSRRAGRIDAYPHREPGSDNPHPEPDSTSRNYHPPRNTPPWPRRRPVLVFPGLSLELGDTPRYFEGRKGNDGKGSTGNTRGATAARRPAISPPTEMPVTPLNLPNARYL